MANPIPNLFRVPELKEKILFTLFILLIYRFGAHVTVPGVDVGILRQQFGALQGGILGIYDMFVGGGLSRATILALGIMPYISASIMFQLLAAVFPTVEKMQKEGEDGRQKLTQWTRYTTVILSVIQGFSYAAFLNTTGAVRDPGFIFNLTTTVTLTVGAIFVMWLGEQITERGIGNGMSLLIFFSIIEGFPAAVARTWESFIAGQIQIFALVGLVVVLVGITAAVVAMTMGARKIPVQIPRKVVGRGRIREGQKSFVPLRVNSAGVMPIIFAQSFIVVPGTIAQLAGADRGIPRSGRRHLSTRPRLLRHLRPADRIFHIFLHGHHLQPRRSGRKPQEARGLRSGCEARGADRRIHRSDSDPRHTAGVGLSGAHCFGAFLDFQPLQHPNVLFRRNGPADRGGRRTRYGPTGSATPLATPLRRLHEEGPSENARPVSIRLVGSSYVCHLIRPSGRR